MAVDTAQQLLERLLLQREIEEFLYMEAELLDTRRYSEWIKLVADDIHYWMPQYLNVKYGDWEHEESDSNSEISWMDEGKATLVGRVNQLNTGLHWAEEPLSRVCHIVSNVQILEVQGDEVKVKSRFFVYRNRLRDEVDLFVGKREDTLRRDSETNWKIARRKIILDQNVLLAKNITVFF